jgi:Tol biopolymer transport system component
MTDVHPYRAEPDAAFTDRLERELLRRLAEPAGSTATKKPLLRKAPPTERDVNEIDLEVAGGGPHPSRLRLAAAGLIAAGFVTAFALIIGNTRESPPAVVPPGPPAANGLIAFAGATDDNPTESDIYVVAPDGTGLRALTLTPELVEYAPIWSPDGRRLAFVRVPSNPSLPCATSCQLVVVDPSSGAETFSAEIPQPDGAAGGPWVPASLAWSPDGRAIGIKSVACGAGGCGGENSVIVELESGALTALTPRYSALWSPDGDWLLLDQGGSMLVVPADLIGTGVVVDIAELPDVLPVPERPGDTGAEWMPDGSALVVSGGSGIDVVTVADGERRTLIEDGYSPVVSPDGSQIAYSRETASGDAIEIWVAAADGSDPRRVAVSLKSPLWSPDGSLLLAADEQGWFTMLPDGTGRTEITPFLPPDRFAICCPESRPSWQPLRPGSSIPTEPSAIEIALGFLDAYGAYDADRALSYLTDEAIDDARPVEIARTPEEFRLELALLEAIHYRHTITGCEEVSESPAGTAIRCTFDMHEFGSDEVGLGPYTDNYWDLTVRDGTLTAAVSSWAFDTNGSSHERWEPFADWVRRNYPDEVLALYTDDSQVQFVDSEEAVLLLARRVNEFVAEEVARLEPARALMAAWVAGDGDAAAALFTPDGTWEDLAGEQLPALHDWLRAIGAEYRSDGCTVRPQLADVECPYSVDNDLTRSLGTGPIANSFVVDSADGGIASVNDVPNEQLDEVWLVFLDWVNRNHGDDAERMFMTGSILPLLDATSIELWIQHVDEFVDDATADIASTDSTSEEDT